jgi:hypothetical protein
MPVVGLTPRHRHAAIGDETGPAADCVCIASVLALL